MAYLMDLPQGKVDMAIYYLDPNPEGSPIVLFLHGLGADSSSWFMQFESLIREGMRPIAIDVPGFGKSIFNHSRWRIPIVTNQIVQMLDQIGVNQFHLVGLSMGGPLALNMVLEYPDRVDKLILVNTFACLRSVKADERRYFIRRLILSTVRGVEFQAEMVAKRVFPHPEQVFFREETIKRILEADRNVYRQAMRSLGLFDVRKKLVFVNKETLVISGKNDTTVPLYVQMELVKGIRGAKQIILPQSGHAAPVDQPDLFNRVMVDFLKHQD